MDKQVTGIIIRKFKCEVVTFIDNLQEIYKLVDADMVEMPVRYIGHRPYFLIVDEEGLLRIPHKAISAYCVDAKEMLVGNILIVPACEDEDGKLTSCQLDDVAIVANAVQGGILYYGCKR